MASNSAEREAGHAELEAAYAQLAEQQIELELTNQQLQDNAVELEQQAEELQATAAELEERTREAEEARGNAEAAERRLQTVFALAPAVIAVTEGPEHRFVLANGLAEQVAGRTGLVGKPYREAFPELESQGFADTLDRVYATGEPFVANEMPVMLDRGEGKVQKQWYSFVYQPLVDSAGRVSGIMQHAVDVSAQVLARESIEGREREIRTLADAIPTLAWTARSDGYIDWYNARWYEYTGTTPEEMAGWGWQSVHDPVLLPGILASWQGSVASGEPFELTFPLRRRDGEFRWFLTRAIPLRDSSGNVQRWFGTNTDVTPEREVADALARANAEAEARAAQLQLTVEALRTQTEEAVRARADAERAEARTRALQSLTAAFSAATTADEVVATFLELGVPSVGARTGLIALLSADRSIFDRIWGAGYPDWLLDRYRDIPAGGSYSINAAVAHGAPQWVHSPEEAALRFPGLAATYDEAGLAATATVPLLDADGTSSGALVFNFATPQQFGSEEREFIEALAGQCAQALERAQLYAKERDARREAEEANASKSRFLANMSHELRQPLNAITGYSDLIKLGVRGPVTEQQMEDLDRIKTSSAHLTALIGDILEFARIEADQLSYNVTDVPLDAILAEVSTFVLPQIAAKQLSYDYQHCDAELTVRADRDRLTQAVLNLLTNATKYTPEGGAIALSCALADSDQDSVEIRVADTGVGIPQEKLGSIFDPFVQAHRALNRPAEGVGLGLAIARDIARHMGGNLTVESVPRVGSTFVLTLPRR